MSRTTILTTPRLMVTTFVRHGRIETHDETVKLVRSYRNEQAERGWTKWRLADRRGNLLGRSGFGDHGAGRELGYTIRRARWGRGLATEIAGAFVSWHREHAPGEDLWAYAAVENVPNCRVLEKAGFRWHAPAEHNGLPCHLFRIR